MTSTSLVPMTATAAAPVPAGAVAVICVGESTVKDVAGTEPNVTSVTFVKSVPVMTTVAPADPLAGATACVPGQWVMLPFTSH